LLQEPRAGALDIALKAQQCGADLFLAEAELLEAQHRLVVDV
jgi:hypothetical protein